MTLLKQTFPGSPIYPVDNELVLELGNYFTLRELVPPACYQFGVDCWALFDPNLLRLLLEIREEWGRPLFVNGQGRTMSGWRPMDSTVGAARSAHKAGQALDLHTEHWQDLDDLYALAEGNPRTRELENRSATPSWVHISVRPWAAAGLRVVSP